MGAYSLGGINKYHPGVTGANWTHNIGFIDSPRHVCGVGIEAAGWSIFTGVVKRGAQAPS